MAVPAELVPPSKPFQYTDWSATNGTSFVERRTTPNASSATAAISRFTQIVLRPSGGTV